MGHERTLDGTLVIGVLPDPVGDADLSALCALLGECVRLGASIGFVEPLPGEEVRAYWRKVLAEASAGNRLVLAARAAPGGPLVGSAQVAFESRANGRHRAEVQKVMVLGSHRRSGVASALMAAAESAALARGVRLLHLDTSEGKGGARAFYEALGYTYVGGIPGYALDPDGTPKPNAILYKELR